MCIFFYNIICGLFKLVIGCKIIPFQGIIMSLFSHVRHHFLLNLQLSNYFFPPSHTVLEIESLTLKFDARWRCQWSLFIGRSHLTVPRHDCGRSGVNRGGQDLSRHPYVSFEGGQILRSVILNPCHYL